MTRCVWVDSRKAEGFPVGAACSAAGIATTTFYEWVARYVKGPCARDVDEAYLVNEMVRIHRASNGAYGSPTIHAQLRSLGWVVNHKKVERLMRENSIVGVFKPAKVRTTIPADDDFEIPDLLRRKFAPGRPGVAWAGDITYIPTGEGWLYLAGVIDLGSRRLIGYSMADHMRTELVTDALNMAAGASGPTTGVIFHGDRGAQYMSGDYRKRIKDLGMLQSVGRTGVSNDNPYSEAWFKTLKYAPVFPERFGSLADARAFMDRFVEHYNHVHLHTGIGLNTPADVHFGLAATKAEHRAAALATARATNPTRFTNNEPMPKILQTPTAAWINQPQQKPEEEQELPAA